MSESDEATSSTLGAADGSPPLFDSDFMIGAAIIVGVIVVLCGVFIITCQCAVRLFSDEERDKRRKARRKRKGKGNDLVSDDDDLDDLSQELKPKKGGHGHGSPPHSGRASPRRLSDSDPRGAASPSPRRDTALAMPHDMDAKLASKHGMDLDKARHAFEGFSDFGSLPGSKAGSRRGSGSAFYEAPLPGHDGGMEDDFTSSDDDSVYAGFQQASRPVENPVDIINPADPVTGKRPGYAVPAGLDDRPKSYMRSSGAKDLTAPVARKQEGPGQVLSMSSRVVDPLSYAQQKLEQEQRARSFAHPSASNTGTPASPLRFGTQSESPSPRRFPSDPRDPPRDSTRRGDGAFGGGAKTDTPTGSVARRNVTAVSFVGDPEKEFDAIVAAVAARASNATPGSPTVLSPATVGSSRASPMPTSPNGHGRRSVDSRFSAAASPGRDRMPWEGLDFPQMYLYPPGTQQRAAFETLLQEKAAKAAAAAEAKAPKRTAIGGRGAAAAPGLPPPLPGIELNTTPSVLQVDRSGRSLEDGAGAAQGLFVVQRKAGMTDPSFSRSSAIALRPTLPSNRRAAEAVTAVGVPPPSRGGAAAIGGGEDHRPAAGNTWQHFGEEQL